ncbi:hypothetical protein OH77DRAFT_1419025, partial [Trametes cingulata]
MRGPVIHPEHPPHRNRVSVAATIRATGHDDLKVNIGMGRTGSVYDVTLGPIRTRSATVVEFLGYCKSFIHEICYVQVPAQVHPRTPPARYYPHPTADAPIRAEPAHE